MTFPVVLTLQPYPEGIRLVRTPVAELTNLRTDTVRVTDRIVGPNPLVGVRADTYEISATFDVRGATARSFGLRLHTPADGGTVGLTSLTLHHLACTWRR